MINCGKCGNKAIHVQELTLDNITLKCHLCGWVSYYTSTSSSSPVPSRLVLSKAKSLPKPKPKKTWECQKCAKKVRSATYKKWCDNCKKKVRKTQMKKNFNEYQKRWGRGK